MKKSFLWLRFVSLAVFFIAIFAALCVGLVDKKQNNIVFSALNAETNAENVSVSYESCADVVFTTDKEVILCHEYNGKYFAMTATETLAAATEITVSDGKITSQIADCMLWTAKAGDGGLSLYNKSLCKYLKAPALSGVKLSETEVFLNNSTEFSNTAKTAFCGFDGANYSKVDYYQSHVSFTIFNRIETEIAPPVTYCTVTFSSGATGTTGEMGAQTVLKDYLFILPECQFNREHYVFKGWNCGENVYNVGESITINKDTTITAVWEIKKYTVELVDGSNSTKVEITALESYVLPEYTAAFPNTTVKDHYVFKGWSCGENVYNVGESITINKDTTFTAVWEIKKYTVELVDGSNSVKVVVIALEGYVLPEYTAVFPNSTTKEHYVFKGWICGENVYNVGETFTISEDTTITAVWEIKKYTVELVDGTNSAKVEVTALENYVLPDYTAIFPNTTVKDHYVFKGWSCGENVYNVGETLTISEDTTITAVWEIKKYTVELVDGTNSAKVEVTALEGYVLPEYTAVFPNATIKDHYVFKGWSCGNNVYKVGENITINKDTTITAVWEIKKYTVELVDGSNSVKVEVTALESYVLPEYTAIFPNAEEKEHYVFKGWSCGENVYNVGESITINEDTTITAVWEIKKYTVELVDGTNSAKVEVTALESYGLPEYTAIFPNAEEKEHYVFKGWSCGENVYNVGESITINEDTTITAVWEIKKYTVELVDGSNSVKIELTALESYVLPEYTAIFPNAEEKEHYVFKGWSCGENVYNVGESITINEDTTIAAVWEIKKYTVELVDGSNSVKIELTALESYILPEYAAVFPNSTTKEHYVFKGWICGENKLSVGTKITITQNVTFTAWKTELVKITFSVDDVSQTIYVEKGNTVNEVLKTYDKPLTKIHYNFSGWKFNLSDEIIAEDDSTPILSDTQFVAHFIAKEYFITFKNGEEVVEKVGYTVEKTLQVPTVPFKAHYVGRWENFELYADEITVCALYTPIEYVLTFIADGQIVEKVLYTIESKPTLPEVPFKAHYVGKWEDFELTYEDKTVNAVYTAKEYTVTFKADGNVVYSCTYTVKNNEITLPNVPQKTGYEGKWEDFALSGGHVVVEAQYSLITFHVRFIADGIIIREDTFTVLDSNVTAPKVPEKEGYTGAWENVEMTFSDLEIKAVYTAKKYTITFKNSDGSIIATVTVSYGEIPKCEKAEENEGFLGWDKDVTAASGDTIYTAVYANQDKESGDLGSGESNGNSQTGGTDELLSGNSCAIFDFKKLTNIVSFSSLFAAILILGFKRKNK